MHSKNQEVMMRHPYPQNLQQNDTLAQEDSLPSANSILGFFGGLKPRNYAESFVQNAISIGDITQNTNELGAIGTRINANFNNLREKSNNIDSAVQRYFQYRTNNPDLYTPDEKDLLFYEKDKTTKDVVLEDTNQLLLQQNNAYLIGSVTAATLLIAAIMISSD